MAVFKSTYYVSYRDTDQMGVVYYANYLEYFERSRTEMLRAAGLPYSELEKLGVILPVKEAHCNYVNSAHYDDLLTFVSYIVEQKGASLKIATEIRRGEELIADGYVVLVAINPEHKVIRIPEILKAKCSELFKD